MSSTSSPVTTRQKHVLAQQPAIAEETEDEALDADLSDDGDQGIDSVKYLLVLQQIRQESLKSSRASLERQITLIAAEFRGETAALLEAMNEHTDKIDDQSVEYAECITAQAFADAAREWNTQRNMVNEAREINFGDIQRKEDVNEVSQLIEGTATKRAQAHRKVLRKVKADLEVIHEKKQVVTDAKALLRRYKKLLRV